MTENPENRTEIVARSSKNVKHNRFDEQESDAEAVAAERTGRTNAAHDMLSGPEQGPPPGRWDSIGEPGEGLDELQGLYAADTTAEEQLPVSSFPPRDDHPFGGRAGVGIGNTGPSGRVASCVGLRVLETGGLARRLAAPALFE